MNPALPVVAVSARGELEAGDFSERGFAGCLRKPFTANELIAVLDAVCGAGKARSAGDTEGAEKSGAAGTVVGAGEPVSAGRHVGKREADGAADNAAVVSEDGVNFGPLTAYAGDDAEAARGILESFAEQSAANCPAARTGARKRRRRGAESRGAQDAADLHDAGGGRSRRDAAARPKAGKVR